MFSALLLSCEEMEDIHDDAGTVDDLSIKSILAYADHPQRETDTLDVSFSMKRDSIYLTTRALPVGESEVDLTKIHLELGLAENATSNVADDQVLDLSDDTKFELVISNTLGNSVSYILKAFVTPPYEVIPEYETTVTELWTKSGTELSLAYPGSCRDITVAGDHLLILDNTIDYMENAAIRAYDKMTGDFYKNVSIYEGGWSSVRSYTWTLQSGEAGHFAIGRLNSGGAGFWLDVYENIDAMPTNPFKLSGTEVPENAGKRMQILGNLLSGDAYVNLTVAHFYGSVVTNPGQYCFWSLKDGVPVSSAPTIMSYTSGWYSAIVQKASLTDPRMYITYNDESSYPNDPADTWESMHGAHFTTFVPGGAEAPLEIDPSNFMYRILDADVFTLNGLTYYATLQQGYSTGTGAMRIRLYNITGEEKYRMKPGSENYGKFLLYESDDFVSPNDLRYGSVAVDVDEETKSALIFVYFPSADPDAAKVTCLKLQLGEEIK